jgi:hypothetical protein
VTGLELATALAVVILVVGSAAIFLWFLVDLAGELRGESKGADDADVTDDAPEG